MAKCLNVAEGFTLSDLTQQDGVVFEIGDYQDMDDEEFSYSSTVPLTNDEIINLLNLDDFPDDDDDNGNDETSTDNSIMLCNVSFEKLKARMTDILGNGKIMKLVKQKGVGPIVPSDAQVTIKYVGHFEYTDEPFDSSFARGRADTYRLNQGMLIPGLEMAISSMQKHEIAVFIVHPDLAYGKFGCAPRIPPNVEILFIVHLVDYLDNGCADTMKTMSMEDRKVFANVVKQVKAKFNTAKNNFKMSKVKQAIREYSRGVQWLEMAELKDQAEEDEFKRLLSRGYNNLAVCYNIENMPRRVCNACNRVPLPSAKTHFNFGRALLKMGEYDRAMEKLQMSLKLEPKNAVTIMEIKLVNEKQRKYLEMEKQLWKNCLKTDQKEIKTSAFRKVVHDMCEAFKQDNQLRLPLPEALTPEEDACVREEAAAFGLSVTTHQRYGREITYLNKSNY
ncbi:inactive peptidyl-prolyl cis-trans isomerase FKBP6 isoform X1 [Hylaeus volcanicus]|uniref:inactive peptidyl-prolyl cis-trans isomerase FKBP6 isoform X1 n=1 Tax=Hylaeus volcanicus TaxID=313075 RepID=UPI0023B875ED|nr:inactive peptidyl-prolyl cis-trans isomerase FKBP6 isoform X1 [Hylaeus volcanicus]